MAFNIKYLTVRNFMSVGNATQAIDFDRQDLTLVLGENLDLGGDDHGARNGTGKTTIINALSYSLFGSALTNIKKDNLINKTNSKHMMVTIDFEVDGVTYRVERGRKPNLLKFYIGDDEQDIDNESQGDSRETQRHIERSLGMSHDMFKHIVALNTYTEPFLSLRSNDQRALIEQLLGITLLSEKAEALKEQSKNTKALITQEEFRISAVTDANKRIEEQIKSLKQRQRLWLKKKDKDIDEFVRKLETLAGIDIDKEIETHNAFPAYNKELQSYNDALRDLAQCDKDIVSAEKAIKREETAIDKVKNELVALDDNKCYACGQDLHDEDHETVKSVKTEQLDQRTADLNKRNEKLEKLQADQAVLGEACEANPKPTAPGTTRYKTIDDAYSHKNTLDQVTNQLEAKMNDEDPYAEQIVEMNETALETIDFSLMNDYVLMRDHQEFLHKLLTNKDSYIRKRIIEQNLSYLNTRLGSYLDDMGLPHQVVFQNDLSVEISELGRDLDFDNLSRGERNRLILSLSWAFRDVWESLYQPINLLFIDELVDSGLDTIGVENALGIMKKMARENNKSVWLVSHKEDLQSRVNNILSVVKESGFTSYANNVEIE